uniref:Reverse transcriptase domain-containing protein n=1 Tax=Nothobranchius furzeri TaxID=105023 RepID=A0A8C6M681_NOTFU
MELRIFWTIVFFITFFTASLSGESVEGQSPIVYSRDQLLALGASSAMPTAEQANIPREVRRKRRGTRAGIGRRSKVRRYRPAIPSIIMGNVRSLPNKVDELAALTRHQRSYRECGLLCFTESWLTELTPDSHINMDGFHLIRADRTTESGKKRGGGLAVFVNDRWCNSGHLSIKERLCCKDIELLAVSMRPYYLPREFTHVIVIAVYVPPSAGTEAACEVLHTVTSRLQTQHPQALFLISGDFNHISLSSTLPTFTQYVTCHTRDNKTLDLLYANTKEAYSSSPLPPLGGSDHNLVHLQPVYKPLVRREPVVKRTVRRWSAGTEGALRDCFRSTVWDNLCSPLEDDLNSITDCITDYMNFCVDNTVPIKKIRCFSNNKPWINPEIKALLKEKKRVFRSGDKQELRVVQKKLKWKIRQGKENYRRKMEEQLQQDNIRGVWNSLKTISGQKPTPQAVGDLGWVNDLNKYFNRFDQPPTPPTASSPLLQSPLSSGTACPSPQEFTPLSFTPPSSQSLLPPPASVDSIIHTPPPKPTLSISAFQVRNELRKIKVHKAAGPDGVSSRLLRCCADELCGILGYLFNLSLSLGKVPQLWKTSCVVPVPKTSHPKDLSSYRPVALTSHLMKTLERLVLNHLRPLVRSSLDPLQFAYQPGIGVEDAIIYLLHRALTHLEKPGSTVRIMFFDFSSAFNTIQPRLLKDKLELSGVDHHMSQWILDYLTERPQYVRSQGCVSDTLVCSTGAPQGTVLAPFLFTLYTADFSISSPRCHLQKFSDDSAIVGLITGEDDSEYRRGTLDFVDWCQQNHLLINAGKTKELVVDFRRRRPTTVTPVNIQGVGIEIVDSYRYLGVHLNNKLDWSHNTDALYRKGQSRLYLLRWLRSFGVQGALLKSFYDSVVASVIFYSVVCWSSSLLAAERKRLDKLIRKASSVLGCTLDPVQVVGDRRSLAKITFLMDRVSHPMHVNVAELQSSFSDRLLHPRCMKERFRRSFLPAAVRLYNQNCSQKKQLSASVL